MDARPWHEDEKVLRERRRQQEVAKGLEQIKRSVNANKITDAASLMCVVECTKPLARQKAITKIDAFIKSEELKELAGPVPHRSDPTELELCALYLQEFSPLQETCLTEQPELVLQALKLGSHIINLRKETWARHKLDPHQHYVDLIKNAYAHLETAVEEK
jgi:hypothetical protein